jgi:predicted transcriptional regulator
LDEKVRRLSSHGMIERVGSVIRLTPAKLSVSNEVLVELLR